MNAEPQSSRSRASARHVKFLFLNFSMFSWIDVNKSYAIESCKLKKSYRQSNFAELLIDQDMKITDVPHLKIEENVYSISEILRGEATKRQKFLKL